MPIELGFILARFVQMAEADESLRERQPWKAAWERDYRWLGEAITKHYHGDDSQVKVLMGALLHAFAGQSVEDYCSNAEAFLRAEQHPTLGRPLVECGYLPMIDLLRYLEANGFTNYIASGGDRDFMRPVTSEIYGIPAERVIGSSNALAYADDEHGGVVTYQDTPDAFDDGSRQSRSASGAASGSGRSWPEATRMGTSRCFVTPVAESCLPCASSCSMTMASASSRIRPARSSRSSSRDKHGSDGAPTSRTTAVCTVVRSADRRFRSSQANAAFIRRRCATRLLISPVRGSGPVGDSGDSRRCD